MAAMAHFGFSRASHGGHESDSSATREESIDKTGQGTLEAKHECEESKEGVRLQPVLAMQRRKTNGSWTEKHSDGMRNWVVDGCWAQKRLSDTGWSDDKKCPGRGGKEGTEKHRLHHGPASTEVRKQIPQELMKWVVERGVEMAKRPTVAPAWQKQLEEKS